MRLLVADKIDRLPLDELEILGVDVVHDPALTPDDLPNALGEVDILVVRHTPVTRAALDRAPGLSLIVRAGPGVGAIDVAAASANGIYVTHCPGRQSAAVAELAMGLVLALDRQLVDATNALRDGRWERGRFRGARGIHGRRLGIAGFGGVGRLLAQAARGFGMDVYTWSRSVTSSKAQKLGIKHTGSLRELASSVDVLSLHLPLNEHTRGIVGRDVLAALADDAILINTAHPEIVDGEALREILAEKRLRLGLDVFADAPSGLSEPFQASEIAAAGPNAMVYGTPHIGPATAQAERAIAAEVVRIVRAFLTEEELPNVVNVLRRTPARYALVLRSRDQVGVLANVLGVVKRHGLNIEEIKNHVFEGASAACTKLRVSGRPSEACLQEIRAFEEVLHVDVVPLPNLA